MEPILYYGTAGKIKQDPENGAKIFKVTKKPTIEAEIYETIQRDQRFKNFKVLKFVNTYGTVQDGKWLQMDKLHGKLTNVVFSQVEEEYEQGWDTKHVSSFTDALDIEQLSFELGAFHALMLEHKLVPWETELIVQGSHVYAIDFEKYGRVVGNQIHFHKIRTPMSSESTLVSESYPMNQSMLKSDADIRYRERFIDGIKSINSMILGESVDTVIKRWDTISN